MSLRRFDQAIQRMRTGDAQVRADAFDFLREHADAYVGELIAEYRAEGDDALRCLLLELVAEARAVQALELFRGELESMDEAVRFWAVRGLEMLDTREAWQALEHAESEGLIA
ncbi:hypothetical protein [Actinomadura rifamycini]|uniref:hypothetical protein n=1 Tax=Actinomadura rifamycini TaxID=31962 RepID=UPI0003FC00A1|nr:hypothetical protein [Actinomadura rifamycini]